MEGGGASELGAVAATEDRTPHRLEPRVRDLMARLDLRQSFLASRDLILRCQDRLLGCAEIAGQGFSLALRRVERGQSGQPRCAACMVLAWLWRVGCAPQRPQAVGVRTIRRELEKSSPPHLLSHGGG